MITVIAGGIGTGKSAVTEILRKYNQNVISADEINRELLNAPFYIKKIKNIFPEAVENNKINKKLLRNIIFNNEEKRLLLNAVSHPLIARGLKEAAKKSGGNLFMEIPLFSENIENLNYDRVWAVKSSVFARLERIMRRDGVSLESAQKMLDAQKKEDGVYETADLIIENDSSKEDLEKTIVKYL